MGAPVDPLVSLLPPTVRLCVEIAEVGKIMPLDEAPDVPYHPFHAPFLIGPTRRAGMDFEVIMAREVEKLGVKNELRPSFDYHALEIVVPVLPGFPLDLFVGFDVAVQEELHGRAGIEPDEEVPRPGEDEDKAVDLAKGKICLHPVDLGDRAGEELEFMVGAASFPERPRVGRDRGVLARVSVISQVFVHLGRLQGDVWRTIPR